MNVDEATSVSLKKFTQDITFVDSHCHFDFDVFDGKRGELWQKCQSLGVKQLLIPGIHSTQWNNLPELAETLDNVVFSLGLHPWWVEERVEKQIDGHKRFLQEAEIALRRLSDHPACVAIGECGLDKMIETDFALQLDVFQWHLKMADELDLPLVIHCRKADNEILQQLKKMEQSHSQKSREKTHRLRGVIHAFSGSYEQAKQYYAHGFLLGIGGTITYDRANKTRQAVQKMPLEWMLLETDAPDMPLCGMQGQANSPVNVIKVAECLAQLRLRSYEGSIEVASLEKSNTEDLKTESFQSDSALNYSPLNNSPLNNSPQLENILKDIAMKTTRNFNHLFLSKSEAC